jgi:ubiquinone/menaquinone biosynthesis C-methylase UbiE
MTETNLHKSTVSGFGDEWAAFDQSTLSATERQEIFESYFSVFPWESLPRDAQGFDLGCGSGRWALCVAPHVGRLHCIDASPKALAVAKRTLREQPNCSFHEASVDNIPLAPDSMDFGYSLGVLHHIPDTLEGVRSCVGKLKPGAPFLLYLYYSLDNKPGWFRAIWKISDAIRKPVARLPHPLKMAVSGFFAFVVYWPLARFAKVVEKLGGNPERVPLSIYRHRSFYVMRTDSYDRFCTQLERRFSREEMKNVMESAGLRDVRFREGMPYWCAVGYKA